MEAIFGREQSRQQLGIFDPRDHHPPVFRPAMGKDKSKYYAVICLIDMNLRDFTKMAPTAEFSTDFKNLFDFDLGLLSTLI